MCKPFVILIKSFGRLPTSLLALLFKSFDVCESLLQVLSELEVVIFPVRDSVGLGYGQLSRGFRWHVGEALYLVGITDARAGVFLDRGVGSHFGALGRKSQEQLLRLANFVIPRQHIPEPRGKAVDSDVLMTNANEFEILIDDTKHGTCDGFGLSTSWRPGAGTHPMGSSALYICSG